MTEQPPTTLVICVDDCRQECRGEFDIMERLKKAMRRAHNHWIENDEQRQFNAAVTAAYMETFDSAQKERIQRSMRALNSLAMALQAAKLGIPFDYDSMKNPDEDVIPLNRLWADTAPPKKSIND